MTAPIFKTYGEAAAYAKRRAQELGTAVKFGRSNDEWVVFIESEQPVVITARPDTATKPPPTIKHLSWWEHRLEEKRKAEEIEKRRRDAEEKSREADANERQERRPYIEAREKYYRSLSEKQLDKLWNSRESQDVEPDEMALLREIVREAKGITPAYENRVRVCRQCGMVEDNCTCGRSWF